MKISHIEHLGIAVESIEQALPYFENVLGLKCYNIEEVADQKVKTAFLKVGEVKLELLEPTSPDSPIAKFLVSKTVSATHWQNVRKKVFALLIKPLVLEPKNFKSHSSTPNLHVAF